MSIIKNIFNGFKNIVVEIKNDVFLDSSISEKIKSGELKYNDLTEEQKGKIEIVILAYIFQGKSILALVSEQPNAASLIRGILDSKAILKRNPINAKDSIKKVGIIKEIFEELSPTAKENPKVLEVFRKRIRVEVEFLLQNSEISYQNVPDFLKDEPDFAKVMYLRCGKKAEFLEEIKKSKNNVKILKTLANASILAAEEYDNLPEEAKKDMALIYDLINQNPEFMIKKLNQEQLSDTRLALMFVKKNWEYIAKLPKSVRNDKYIAMNLLSQNSILMGSIFPYIGNEIKFDKDVMEKMMSKDRYESSRYLMDEQVFIGKTDDEIKKIIKEIPDLYVKAPLKIREDVNVVKNVIQNILGSEITLYGSFPDSIKKNKEVVYFLLNKEPALYNYLDEEMAADRDCVIRAADKKSFKVIPKELENDKEVIISLLKNGPDLFNELTEEQQKDIDIIRAALKSQGRKYHSLSPDLQRNKEFILLAGKTSNVYGYIPKDLKNDKEIVLELLKKSNLYELLPPELSQDKDVALEIVSRYQSTLGDLSDELQTDKEFLRKVIDLDIANITRLSYQNKTLEAYEIALEKLKSIKKEKKIAILAYAPNNIKENKKLMLEWLDENPREFKNMLKYLTSDIEVATKMCQRDKENIEHIDESIVEHENFLIDYLTVKPNYFKNLSEANKERKDILEIKRVRTYVERYFPNYLDLAKGFDREESLIKKMGEIKVEKEKIQKIETERGKKKI